MRILYSPRSRIISKVLVYASLNEVISGICAILFLLSQDWFGKGDLPGFLYYGIAHSIMVGIFSYLNSRVLTMKSLFLRTLCTIPIGIFLALGWTLAMAYLLLGPMIGAFSIPIFYCWLISGTLVLGASAILDGRKERITTRENQESKRSKKPTTMYFGLLLLLPIGLVGVFWIHLHIGIYWAILFSWEFKEGAIMTRGSDSCMLVNKGTWLTTELGYRRISTAYLEEISIYHALIVYPSSGISSSTYNSDGPKSEEVIEWFLGGGGSPESQKAERQKLIVELNTLDSTVRVGEDEFNLENGNFFLINFDSSWVANTTQFPLFNYKDSGCAKIVDQFNSVLEGKIADYPLIINPRELNEEVSP